MANEKKIEKKAEKKERFSIIRYLKETAGEVKKLTWLSKSDLLSHVAAVFVFVIGMAIIIYGLDFVFSSVMRLIESL
ncbi:MAG: preprotein translocase subunit SecE [Clostridia bacterium]|nr:preprotein translocase subunit SecE [Clostridia bacterium]